VNTTSILNSLPAQLEWVVLFRLSTIRRWVPDPQMGEMFHLPKHVDLKPCSHIVLSSQGRFLAPLKQSTLLLLNESSLREVSRLEATLLDRHRSLFESFEPDAADCLGFAQKTAAGPVLLHLTVKDGDGYAKVLFHREPSGHNYELLRAVGIEYLTGEPTDAGFVALFRNRLFAHLHAASLAGFSRTANCNRFFFNHGEIDANIESGLLQAAHCRVESAKGRGLQAGRELAREASRKTLAMTCQPPPPRNCFSYGDLVPLGFLLNALRRNSPTGIEDVCVGLREKLLGARQGLLWGFHTNKLVTATDSVLVLQGLQDGQGIEALERFSDGHGAYYPQLWSQTKETDRMVISQAKAHWCQPDFATTCLVRGLRAQAGFVTLTPIEYLAEHFETRSGLFFANPYLMDWALACALSADADAQQLRCRLLEEILASMNKDYSFGAYDVALSTGLAILALAALGRRGRLLRMVQLRLLEMMDSVHGTWPVCTPFYSTKRVSLQHRGGNPEATDTMDTSAQIVDVNGTLHELWLYLDTHRIISTAVAVMALSEDCDAQHRYETFGDGREKHERYRCTNHAEYVAEFALRSYVGGSDEGFLGRSDNHHADLSVSSPGRRKCRKTRWVA
jgi:hypothetical protein